MAKLVHGHCDSRFTKVQDLLQANIELGEELGASITVNIAGENVVDIWGGFANQKRDREWEADTIVNVFSTSKNVLSLAILLLVDRGVLDLDETIAHYWPEFGSNGKDKILVRHVLSHTSGVSGWEGAMSIEEFLDVDKATAKLATQAPWWTPGTASGYHAVTMGNILGELIRRITGQNLQDFVSAEIAEPLGVDFRYGVAEKDLHRVSDVILPPTTSTLAQPLKPNQVRDKTYEMLFPVLSVANLPICRNAVMGAANGHSNARSLARILSAITSGGKIPGCTTRLLSKDTIDLIFQEQTSGTENDLVINAPVKWGIGYALAPSVLMRWLPATGRICFWAGIGGSFAVMDLDRKMTIAYAMNKMESSTDIGKRSASYGKAIYEGLGVSTQ